MLEKLSHTPNIYDILRSDFSGPALTPDLEVLHG
jgi:hypothetical protein